MRKKAAQWRHPALQALAVYLAAEALYLYTLAPTVLWGDDARLQRQAYLLDLQGGHASDHPLWVLLAHPFSLLPLGTDIAWRANLFTSLWAALAVAVVFALLRSLTHSSAAGLAGAAVLALSHTFWTHAVRTEVYSLNLALLALALYGTLHPRPNGRRLFVAGLAAGLAAANHIQMWLALPGLAVAAVWRVHRAEGSPFSPLLGAVGFALAAGSCRLLLPAGAALSLNPLQYLPSPGALPRELALAAAYFLLQFPGPALVLVAVGAWQARRDAPALAGLALIALADVAAALGIVAPDKYVFYLPTYLVAAVAAGLGWEASLAWLRRRGPRASRAAAWGLGLALVLAPVVGYAALPALLPRLGIGAAQLQMREIPGRPALRFFLFPPKRGDRGAQRFAASTLAQLPPGAALIADYTVAQPLLYLQAIEGVRPDVRVLDLLPPDQVAAAREEAARGPVYLALTEPYYDIAGLEAWFVIVPEGPLYRLQPRTR